MTIYSYCYLSESTVQYCEQNAIAKLKNYTNEQGMAL